MDDSLGKNHLLLVWEGDKGEETASGPQGISTFEGPPAINPAHFSFLTNTLKDASLWQIDASGAVTVNAVAKSFEQGQVTAADRCVCGYFIIRGSVEEVLQLASELDLSFLDGQEMDDETRAIVEAHTTLTIAPVVGIDAAVVTVWAKEPGDGGPSSLPIEIVIEIITRVHAWTRILDEREVLLDTGRINVRFDTWHLENGERREGRKTAGRLLGIGRYDTEGPSLPSAHRGLRLMAADSSEVVESARENQIQCAQGPENCPRARERPLEHDDPRNALFG